jgi:prepilin-type N-terminal cleavage/methylation domain-containing protein
LKRLQTGFTLIEIAIVLVIFGLLVSSILKGQELIQSARVRSLIAAQEAPGSTFRAPVS